MDNRVLTGARARALKNVNRPLFWVRLFVVTLLLTFGLAIPQPRSIAQAANHGSRAPQATVTSPQEALARNCPECEAALLQCQANGGSNCLTEYQICEQNCF